MKTITEKEIQITPIKSLQVKLKAAIQERDIPKLKNDLKLIFRVENFKFENERSLYIKDIYYDTSVGSIMSMGSCIRIREHNAETELTIKILDGPSKYGEKKWEETTYKIHHRDIKGYEKSNFAKIVRKYFPELKGEQLSKQILVYNNRVSFDITKYNELYNLSFDTYYYEHPYHNIKSRELFEIEIEAKNKAAENNLSKIKHHIKDCSKYFTYSQGNKYTRGMKILKNLVKITGTYIKPSMENTKPNKLFNRANFGNNTTIIVGSHHFQNVNNKLIENNFEKLAEFLRTHNVIEKDITNLKAAIEEDVELVNHEKKKYGENVNHWFKSMMSKAIDASWQVELGTASSLLATAINSYYGWF